MDYKKVLTGAWRGVWNLRALWVFGFILAFTTSSSPFWLWSASDQDVRGGIAFKVSDERTITIFGEGLTIDFTTPGRPQVFFWDGDDWLNFDQTVELLRDIFPGEAWTILKFAGVELVLLLLIGALFRYTSEAAVIRTVQVHEQNSEIISFGQSLRMGWSRVAWRFFGIDLILNVLVGVGLGLLLMLALSPLLLWGLRDDSVGLVGTGLAVALLFPWGLITALAVMGVSMLREISWRVSGQESLGILAGIARGISVIRRNFREVIVTWFVWLGARLLWLVLAVVVTVLLAPLMLVSVVAGALLGLIPALITLGVAGSYMQGITPWILAGLAALPVFVIVTFSPVIFIGGWVRLFLSNLWTLTYHELPPVAEVDSVPALKTDISNMDVAPAS